MKKKIFNLQLLRKKKKKFYYSILPHFYFKDKYNDEKMYEKYLLYPWLLNHTGSSIFNKTLKLLAKELVLKQ
jgi:hypothetical protein